MIIVLIIVTIISHGRTVCRVHVILCNSFHIPTYTSNICAGWKMATILNVYLRNVCRSPGRNCGSPMAFGMYDTRWYVRCGSSVSGTTRNYSERGFGGVGEIIMWTQNILWNIVNRSVGIYIDRSDAWGYVVGIRNDEYIMSSSRVLSKLDNTIVHIDAHSDRFAWLLSFWMQCCLGICVRMALAG